MSSKILPGVTAAQAAYPDTHGLQMDRLERYHHRFNDGGH